MTVSTREQTKRRKADEYAKHELRLEGLSTPPEFEPLFGRYVVGELTTAQVRAQLDTIFKRR